MILNKERLKKYSAIDVEIAENQFKSLSNDPQFIVQSHLFKGGCEINLDIDVKESTIFQLFYDTGKGFNEEESFIFNLKIGKNLIQEKIYFPLKTRAIRIDPVNIKCEFIINRIDIKYNNSIQKYMKYAKLEIASYYWSSLSIFKRFFITKKTYSHSEVIDIIIPIYNAYEMTKDCIESVLENTKHPYNLILINDCSPDIRIYNYLENLKLKGISNITVLHNEKNLGFVGTVNKGMSLSENHVILLNSDTEVPKNWLNRIYNTYASNKAIGTITPFSNNATICSYPNFCEDNNLPWGYDVEKTDYFFEKFGGDELYDIPTGVGFCMFISRECLDQVGLFDDVTFAKGYGEENDFCVRAYKSGFRNVLMCNLFVFHKGSMSFGAVEGLKKENYLKLLKKHPTYEYDVHKFIKRDPYKNIRQRISYHISTNNNEKDAILHVLHGQGGGTEKHVVDLIENTAIYRQYMLEIYKNKYIFTDILYNVKYEFNYSNENSQDFIKLLNQYKISLIHVHHLLFKTEYWMNLIRDLNIPYVVTLHDFYPICPRINMVDRHNKLCIDLNNEEKCNQCLEKNDLKFNDINSISQWRRIWKEFLMNSKKIVAPSITTGEIVESIFDKIRIGVIEHGLDLPQDNYEIAPEIVGPDKKTGAIRIGIVGAISIVKGSRILDNLVSRTQDNELIEWVVIGYTDKINHAMYDKKKKLIIHGRYKDSETKVLLEKYNVDVVLFPAIWPETYSYTLSEVLVSEFPVIVPNLGALGERTKRLNCGWVIEDFNIDNIISVIQELIKNQKEIKEKKENIKNISIKDCALMGEEYIVLYANLLTTLKHKYDLKEEIGVKEKWELYKYIKI